MDPYSEQQPPPVHHSNGCLWGCIGTAVAVVVIFVAVFGYGAWYFYRGFSSDARIQTVMETVRHDARATAMLGHDIKVLEVEMHTFNYSTGHGGTASYVLKVAGSKGSGEIKADLDTSGGKVKIKRLMLTGGNGRRLYLVGVPPPNPMMEDSI